MTSSSALELLIKSGFDVENKSTKLIALLNVSLDEGKKTVSSDQHYQLALEKGLQWWITNSTAPSWKELVSAVESCGDKDISTKLRQQLDITNEGTFQYFYVVISR